MPTTQEVPYNISYCHYSTHLCLAYLWFHSCIKSEFKVTSLGSPSPTTLDYPAYPHLYSHCTPRSSTVNHVTLKINYALSVFPARSQAPCDQTSVDHRSRCPWGSPGLHLSQCGRLNWRSANMNSSFLT